MIRILSYSILLYFRYDKDWPIYQTGQKAVLYTIHTAVFNWEERSVTIFEGNPILRQVRYFSKL